MQASEETTTNADSMSDKHIHATGRVLKLTEGSRGDGVFCWRSGCYGGQLKGASVASALPLSPIITALASTNRHVCVCNENGYRRCVCLAGVEYTFDKSDLDAVFETLAPKMAHTKQGSLPRVGGISGVPYKYDNEETFVGQTGQKN